MTTSLIRILALALLALVVPTAAVANPRRTVAPPGASGVAQYLEVVPTANGPAPPASTGGPGGGAHGGALTGGQRRKLDGLGQDGRTLAAVVDATAPQTDRTSVPRNAAGPVHGGSPEGDGSGQTPGPGGQVPSGPVSSPASLILGAVGGGGGGGLGMFLPAFLLISVLVASGYAVRRQRMRS